MAVKLWVLARVLEKPWEYLPYMDVKGMEYCIFSPKSEELREKKMYLVSSYSFSLHHLHAFSMVSWAVVDDDMHIPVRVASEFLRQMSLLCLFTAQMTCQPECTPPGGRLQKASSAGVPVSQRCRENWWEEFSYFDCKIGLSGFLGYWAQFVSIVLRISLLCLWTRLGSFLFLGCRYIVVIWGDSGLIKWDGKCFIFFLEVLKWIGINSSLDIW